MNSNSPSKLGHSPYKGMISPSKPGSQYMGMTSPSKLGSPYIGDRYIPCRNVEKWDIQFNINENENRSPIVRRPRDFLQTSSLGAGTRSGLDAGGIGIGQQTMAQMAAAQVTAANAVANINNNNTNNNNNINANNINGANNNNNNTNHNNTNNNNNNNNANTNVNNNNANNNNNNSGSSGASNVANLETSKDITMYRAVLKNELLGTSIDGLGSGHHHHASTQAVSSMMAPGSSVAAGSNNSNNSNNNNNNNNQQQQQQGGSANNNNNSSTNQQQQQLQNKASASSRLMMSGGDVLQPRDMTSVFQYGYSASPSASLSASPFRCLDENVISPNSSAYYSHHSPYSLSPLSSYSQKLLRSPRKPMRKIPKVPFKVLDAPELQDDFYLNLVDWSSTNVLGVGLGTSVYLWSAQTSQVTKLCDLANREDSVSSVSWSEKGNYIAVGTFKGDVQIWDAAASKLLSTLNGHTARVGALAWNLDLLCSGSRDRNVFLRDIRAPANESGERKLTGHKQEVCGLKWSPDHLLLASGGNDNKLLVWNVNGGNSPIQTYNDHVAAVKAIAWSPHQHGLLASGGGTADRCIRFWNTLTGQNLQSVDTGSQVCNLAWSKHSNELVSTHGYSQNQILIWKYPSMVQLAKLTGHSYRVLYLAVSPDGEAIVTGAGDETLRFWNVFNKSRCTKESKSVVNLFGKIR